MYGWVFCGMIDEFVVSSIFVLKGSYHKPISSFAFSLECYKLIVHR